MTDRPKRTLDQGAHPAGNEDELLVKRFAQGDSSAFDRIVDNHQARVASLAYRLLGWPDDVDDVVQEVFLAAYKGIQHFRGGSSLSTWLSRITINKCRSHYRKRLIRLRLFSAEKENVNKRPAPSADQQVLKDETYERIRRALQKIPPRYREVLVLRYLEEMSIETICEILDITKPTAEVRLHRGRNKLKALLGNLMEQ